MATSRRLLPWGMTPPQDAALEDADTHDPAGGDLAVADAATDALADALAGVADEALAEWLAALRRDPGPSCGELGVESLRRSSMARAAARPRGPDLALVRDVSIDEVLGGRLYRPSSDPRPLVLFLHGGGFVTGDLDSHDRICRRLAAGCDVAVLAVDYRRAPESPAPAAERLRHLLEPHRHRRYAVSGPQAECRLRPRNARSSSCAGPAPRPRRRM